MGKMTKAEAEKTLGLSGTYTRDDLKSAYRSLVKQYHPDLAQQDDDLTALADKMAKLNEAKDALDDVFDYSQASVLHCDRVYQQTAPTRDEIEEFYRRYRKESKRPEQGRQSFWSSSPTSDTLGGSIILLLVMPVVILLGLIFLGGYSRSWTPGKKIKTALLDILYLGLIALWVGIIIAAIMAVWNLPIWL